MVGGREIPGDVVTDGGREVLLSARGLFHSFPPPLRERGRTKGAVQVLRGVDLELVRGECLAVVGESGSGKTTLARGLLRLIELTEGQVFYRGSDVLAMRRDELQAFRRKAQIVFQDPFGSLNPRLRAGPMLEEVLEVHDRGSTPGSRKHRTEELLQLVGLHPSHVRRYPHEFSGGQRQRLGIARALSVEPELLILDEPVSSLDLSVQAQILNLLRELQDRLSLTLMFVAHDLSVVRQVADRVSVMYLGKIVETSPVDALFANPKHPYTRGLLVAADLAVAESPESESWALLPGELPSLLRPPEGCGFYPRCRHPARDQECALISPELSGPAPSRLVACWKEK
jgi:oligopeptide/dipeptide ABC transporter ATP-binding protein